MKSENKTVAILFKIEGDSGSFSFETDYDTVDNYACQSNLNEMPALLEMIMNGMTNNWIFGNNESLKRGLLAAASTYIGLTKSWKILKQLEFTGIIATVELKEEGGCIIRPGNLTNYESVKVMAEAIVKENNGFSYGSHE